MTDIAATLRAPDHVVVAAEKPKLDSPSNPLAVILFFGFLAAGILYMAYSVYVDVDASGMQTTTYLPFLLLFVALLIALGFEFVNGFHDTANAVATVIYTHSLPAPVAVVWAGVFNFLGVVVSSGAVAFGIISLLPVELILQVGTSAGFAMVFALLFAAIIWNLGTWYLGLPASSSHTLIGSIIGVGVANALMHGQDGTSGVDWSKATEIGYSLLLSPLFGFFAAALLLLVLKLVVRNPALYREPKGNQPPWLQRRPKGHGPHHAHSDRHRADGLCAQSFHAGQSNGGVPDDVRRSGGGRPAEGGRSQHHRRPASGRLALCVATQDQRRYLPVAIRSDPGYLEAGVRIRLARTDSGRGGRQYPQRHVSRVGSDPISDEGQGKRSQQGRGRKAVGLQEIARQRDQVHSAVGQGRGRDRARTRHHDRMEAHRRHGGRENRQGAHDLRPRRLRGSGRRRNDRRRRHVRASGFNHARVVVRRSRNDGGQRLGAAVGDRAQLVDGVGADAACSHHALGQSLRLVCQRVLRLVF